MKHYRRILLALAVMLMLFPFQALAAGDMDYVAMESYGRIPIPKTYDIERVIINLGDEIAPLSKAEDLFIDKSDTLYIADAGNNRILKMSKAGEVQGIYTGPEEKPLREPRGIYVDSDGDMYIADYGNSRVVHLSPDGAFVEEFVRPDSSLMDKDRPFKPQKVYLDATGYIYILNESDYHGFITIDAHNRFRGYVAPTRLLFNLSQLLVRTFATQEQKDQLAKEIPPSHSNFMIHDDGMIYATTVMVKADQIKKLNSVGTNIYMYKHDGKKSTFFGEPFSDTGPINPTFVDLAVDKKGIISALEGESRKVYQYDAEGNLLTVFGGNGSWDGKFQSPSSIAADSQGYLYVLDRDLNNIQVFKPTRFIKLVHEALGFYYDGKYPEAVKPWTEVLKIDANYQLAHRGIAKALMKQEKWKEAMEQYQIGEDKTGYSAAFAEYRHDLFRAYFGWVVLAVVAAIVLVLLSVRYLKQWADQILRQFTTWKGAV